jgi:hypothetical protein
MTDVAFTIANQLKRERHGTKNAPDELYSQLVGRRMSEMKV